MFTTDNIANIKRDGQLTDYIAHERLHIAILESATFAEDTAENYISYGGFGGHIGYKVDENPEKICASIVGGWAGEWVRSSFASDAAAEAYARVALQNQLRHLVTERLKDARARLAMLEAA